MILQTEGKSTVKFSKTQGGNVTVCHINRDTFSVPTWPKYDTLMKASLVCRCWCSSRVISAAYGGHLISKIPIAIRQGIRVVSCAEYKNNFLFERGFQYWTFKYYHICVRNDRFYPEVSNLFGSEDVPCSFSSMLNNNMCRRGPTHSCKFSLSQTQQRS